MALETSFCISNKNDCKTMAMTETTGAYSAANLTGYGAPNAEVADITSATLLLEQRNSDGTYTELTTVDIYPTMPNIDGTEYLLTSIDFGLEDGIVIPDGIYRATYTVTYGVLSPTIVVSSKTFVQDCSIKCCFKKLSDKAASETCNKDIKNKFGEMSILMRSLCAAKDCADLITIQNQLTYLTKLCSQAGCGCGCN